MARHRDRIGIIANMLKAAGKHARKTRIMRTANLSYELMKKYLDKAVALGYVRLSQEGTESPKKATPSSQNTSSIRADTQAWEENWRA